MGLVLAIVLTARGKRFDRKMEEARAQLSELLARHLGDGTVSSEAMGMRFMAVWQSFQSFVICWTSLNMRWINIQKISALSRKNRITAAR